MVRANQDIRREAKDKQVFLWQIAEKYQISDTGFAKMLRRELPQEKKDRIFQIIKDLSRGEA